MQPALSISNLQKTYSNGFSALKGIDLEVTDGDFFALLGPNGAGKSTAIGIICSLVNKSAGKVSVYGYDIDRQFAMAKAQLGIVPQEFNFSVFETPLQVVVNQAGYYGIERRAALKRAETYLRKLGLWEKRNEQNRSLSGGMKRRLMIARALIHEPRLLILDEPTAGVDIEIRRSMWQFLKEINDQGTTIILTTHYLEEAESLCRNIAIIDHGEIAENTDMKSLLRQLQQETYVLDTNSNIIDLDGLDEFRKLDDTTLEVDVERGSDLGEVFNRLSKRNIAITSMRNKSNRLEQLFINLVGDSRAKSEGDSRS
ncbi:MAG: ABC-2 type transport system ATP-binding protein [Parasphingorhabdus sp.]|jgi:ABC-2 type transport system ATP-binding protein